MPRALMVPGGYQYICRCGNVFRHPTKLVNGKMCPTCRSQRARKGHRAMVMAHGYARLPKAR
jgi:predicted Zn-ribbon and HTH transcriptional regulator